jgi:hypothetical protein
MLSCTLPEPDLILSLSSDNTAEPVSACSYAEHKTVIVLQLTWERSQGHRKSAQIRMRYSQPAFRTLNFENVA